MSNQSNEQPKQKLAGKDIALRVVLIVIIAAILFFLITFLYIPSLSYGIYGTAAFSGFNGADALVSRNALVLAKDVPFADLKFGDLMVFKLSGQGEADGLKIYTIFGSGVDAATEELYYLVGSSDATISYTWRITESMYRGAYASHINGLGAITGFFGSVFGIIFIVVLIVVIVVIVYIVKKPGTESKIVENETEQITENEVINQDVASLEEAQQTGEQEDDTERENQE